jgi:hypothetical protein
MDSCPVEAEGVMAHSTRSIAPGGCAVVLTGRAMGNIPGHQVHRRIPLNAGGWL